MIANILMSSTELARRIFKKNFQNNSWFADGHQV